MKTYYTRSAHLADISKQLREISSDITNELVISLINSAATYASMASDELQKNSDETFNRIIHALNQTKEG